MTETDVVLSDVGVCCGVSLFETAGVMGKWPFFQFHRARSLIKWLWGTRTMVSFFASG